MRQVTVLTCTLGLLGGCLYQGDPGQIDAEASSVLGMDGLQVELIRYSTQCGSEEPPGLVAEVGDGMEYSAEAVKNLESSCPEGPNPGVEVYVENRAVLFDFSNVTEPGGFPAGEFEGYILDIVGNAEAPFMIAVAVDREVTTVDLDDIDLTHDLDRLEVNFAGIFFDSSSFLKIDLLLARGPVRADEADEVAGM